MDKIEITMLRRKVASFLGKTSSDVKPFIVNLLEMGLVKRIKVFGKNKWIYKIASPVVDLFYSTRNYI